MPLAQSRFRTPSPEITQEEVLAEKSRRFNDIQGDLTDELEPGEIPPVYTCKPQVLYQTMSNSLGLVSEVKKI